MSLLDLNSKDAKTIQKYDLTDIEAENYIERMGFLVEEAEMKEDRAERLAISEIMRRRREMQ